MFGHICFLFRFFEEPVTGRQGIGHGFLGSERFRSDQEKCTFGIHFFQGFRNMGAIDIGYKKRFNPLHPIRFQCLRYHQRPQVTSTNTDIDNVLYFLIGIPTVFPAMDLLTEPLHFFEHFLNAGHYIHPLREYRLTRKIAEGCMQDCPFFSRIDLLPVKHRLNCFREFTRHCQFIEQLQGLLIQDIL